MSTVVPQYAATYAQTGSGDVVFISVHGTNFTQIMATQKIAYSGQQKDFEETTTTTSVGAYKEFQGTLKDPGKFTFDLVFNPSDAGQVAILAAYDANTNLTVKHQYKAQTGFTTGPSNVFSAQVESDPLAGSDAGKVAVVSVSLKISGPITKNPAS